MHMRRKGQDSDCKQPFSDSSSLARHRRIHSGTRPYKCHHPTCQKAFTRRTTLTRHQQYHTGGGEDVAAEDIKVPQSTLDESYSDAQSSGTSTTPSAENQSSTNPDTETSAIPLQRQSSDFQYMMQNQSLPPHIRSEYGVPLRHHPSMSTHSVQNYTGMPLIRPNITSNPTAFGPPQPLEPPANGTASGAASPHMTNLGWGSPNNGLPSPNPMDFGTYPDPVYGQQMFFPGNGMRRPQSTEPEDWSLRSTRNPNNNFNHHMHLTHDWSALPVTEVKQERAFAM